MCKRNLSCGGLNIKEVRNMGVPISLNNFFYKKLNVRWIDGVCCNETPYGMSFSFDLRTKKDNPNNILLTLGIKVMPTEKFQGIGIDAKIEGFFSIDDAIDDSRKNFYSIVNSATILYGIFRGQLNLLTSSFPCERFILPTVMMKDEVEKYFSQMRQNH